MFWPSLSYVLNLALIYRKALNNSVVMDEDVLEFGWLATVNKLSSAKITAQNYIFNKIEQKFDAHFLNFRV